jgi:hypothetical protein
MTDGVTSAPGPAARPGETALPVARPRVTRRGIQLALGLLWILDGLLQFQPDMFSRRFATQVIAPAGAGHVAARPADGDEPGGWLPRRSYSDQRSRPGGVAARRWTRSASSSASLPTTSPTGAAAGSAASAAERSSPYAR